ncbi:hypothetical protein DSL72_001965 [Monilinia vaccinii-corymbosi]|uniref:MYND-type domain-containing protein n=1 Tax=Monilinia vaccinii-corymbosi TaxID=61207 RepID=A0A8A3PBA9_9HELO|nr:hypothetical protein DSL72_001965 [Monilinia vaccinii-corymbosi]
MASRRDPNFGPRVSICSFGPRIEHPKCGYCTIDASIPCITCNATWYCTLSCQELDRSVHDMICQIYADFVTANPCPADTFEKKYRLCLLLPVDSKVFSLAWIANGSRGKSAATFLQYYDQDRINTRQTLVDYNMRSKQFDHAVFLAVRGEFGTDSSPPNACINHIMNGNLKYTFKGPVLVACESGHDQSRTAQHFQPHDFRILIDFLFNYDGKPGTELGHACGDQGALGKSKSAFRKFFRRKSQNGRKNSANTPVDDVEGDRTHIQRAEHLTNQDWTRDSASSFSEHKVRRSTSVTEFGSPEDDVPSINRPESFVGPDFLLDWIIQSPLIYAGLPLHSQADPVIKADMKGTARESASRESIEFIPRAQGTNHVYQNANVIVKNSMDILNHNNASHPQSPRHNTASSISESLSPSFVTTFSFFQPEPARRDRGSLELDAKSSAFSRPASQIDETIRNDDTHQRNMTGSIMSPWMV